MNNLNNIKLMGNINFFSFFIFIFAVCMIVMLYRYIKNYSDYTKRIEKISHLHKGCYMVHISKRHYIQIININYTNGIVNYIVHDEKDTIAIYNTIEYVVDNHFFIDFHLSDSECLEVIKTEYKL